VPGEEDLGTPMWKADPHGQGVDLQVGAVRELDITDVRLEEPGDACVDGFQDGGVGRCTTVARNVSPYLAPSCWWA